MENKKNSDQPAFANPGSDLGPGSHGLTKREYFTGLAMQGLLANPEMGMKDKVWIANESVLQADAILTQLNQQEGDKKE